MTKKGDDNDYANDKSGANLRSEEGKEGTHDDGAENLVDTVSILDHLFLNIVVKAKGFSLFVEQAGSADNDKSTDREVPEVNSDSSFTEGQISTLVG